MMMMIMKDGDRQQPNDYIQVHTRTHAHTSIKEKDHERWWEQEERSDCARERMLYREKEREGEQY